MIVYGCALSRAGVCAIPCRRVRYPVPRVRYPVPRVLSRYFVDNFLTRTRPLDIFRWRP